MLQAGRSRVRVPMRSLNSYNLPYLSTHTMSLGLTQPLIEMSTRKVFLRRRAWPERAADLTAIPEPTVYTIRDLNIPQPCKPPWSVTEIAF
jgi:hypothetical protein